MKTVVYMKELHHGTHFVTTKTFNLGRPGVKILKVGLKHHLEFTADAAHTSVAAPSLPCKDESKNRDFAGFGHLRVNARKRLFQNPAHTQMPDRCRTFSGVLAPFHEPEAAFERRLSLLRNAALGEANAPSMPENDGLDHKFPVPSPREIGVFLH